MLGADWWLVANVKVGCWFFDGCLGVGVGLADPDVHRLGTELVAVFPEVCWCGACIWSSSVRVVSLALAVVPSRVSTIYDGKDRTRGARPVGSGAGVVATRYRVILDHCVDPKCKTTDLAACGHLKLSCHELEGGPESEETVVLGSPLKLALKSACREDSALGWSGVIDACPREADAIGAAECEPGGA